jgi:hypothetical protein
MDQLKKECATTVRFELTRSMSNGLAIHRLNHSATTSYNHARGFKVYNRFLRLPIVLSNHTLHNFITTLWFKVRVTSDFRNANSALQIPGL